jgi:predicted Zn-dependent peptidase
VLARQEPGARLVAIYVFINTGSAEEDESNCGIGSFVASSLFSGTVQQSKDKIQYMVNDLGNNAGAVWDTDYTQIHALTLTSRFQDSAYLICDILKNANFPDSEVEKNRETLLQGFVDRSNDVFTVSYDSMRRILYKGTPRQYAMNGDRKVIKSLTAKDLQEFYNKNYIPKNIVISVVGGLPVDNMIDVLKGQLSDFPRKSPKRSVDPLGSGPTPLTTLVSTKQTMANLAAPYILVGYLAPGSGSPDYPAMMVANALLGGMKTSKLFTTVREQKGLAYEVASIYNPQIAWGDVSAFMLITPPSDASGMDGAVEKAKDTLLKSIKEFANSTPTDADVERAKSFLIGGYLIQHERLDRRAYYLGYSEIAQKELGGSNFDQNYAKALNQVTAADVRRAAHQYFGSGAAISIVLPGNPNDGVISK